MKLNVAPRHNPNLPDSLPDSLTEQRLLDVLGQRRSRRFAKGMSMEGPLEFKSQARSEPLTEAELAALSFAACGVTGHALAELPYTPGGGGTMMASFLGRTVSSADAVHSVGVFLTNDEGTFYLKRPQDFSRAEYPEIVELSRCQDLVGLFRRSRVQVKAGRSAPPLHPPFNLDVNKWDLYAPGTTYFVPVSDFTYMYINGLLEFLNETMGIFVVDERKGFRPAGLKAFGGAGGHLDDKPASGKTITIDRLEAILQGVVTVEQGMILQNLGLMAHAMGLGGFPNFAGHEFAWFQALGFRMQEMKTLSYMGAGPVIRFFGSLLGKNLPIPFPIGLEIDGEWILKPYCPPHYKSMEEAVHAVIDFKWGSEGLFGLGSKASAWSNPAAISKAGARPSQKTIDATVAFCSYLYRTYGRFPAYPAPYKTNVGFQSGHLDPQFYEKYYRTGTIPEHFHRHHDHWHKGS
jgi:hypothetical protein